MHIEKDSQTTKSVKLSELRTNRNTIIPKWANTIREMAIADKMNEIHSTEITALKTKAG